ncbi:amidohydrolase family protein [Nocardia alba]|uniref:Amidohydrolase family protein n=1 Tax=Nocardia alba TaxID=225051 RepID=A0A4R1FMZ0_9NOCA|nr:amidohydrolase family protein [Nocardia alba]TCJ96346.1 amidohydrolase family protein [Nocardia alba]
MNADRIDVHQHMIPPVYRDALRRHGITAPGGRDLPDWSPDSALSLMTTARIGSAILSVSTPGTTFLTDPAEATTLAQALNDYSSEISAAHPGQLGFMATLPMPDVRASRLEAERALDTLGADGVVLLGNSAGVYLGAEGQDELFRALDDRCAVVLVHPADLPGEPVPGILPFAADFLLDTTRAAYLLVRNGIRRRYPNIKFILSHGGGFVPYAAHRLALTIFSETGVSPADLIDEFAGFYFDTALSSSASALPSLLSFARPGHVLYGSDWPFAPDPAVLYFGGGLDAYAGLDDAQRRAVERVNALTLFPRFGAAPAIAPSTPMLNRVRSTIRRQAFRGIARAIGPRA